MIHAVELENFKGVCRRTRVELAPVTLLFGANNAGKSTILQALLYVSDIVNHGRADIDRTSLGGGSFDLGGFDRLVNGTEPFRSIGLRVEFDCGASLNCFRRDLDDFPLPNLDDELDRAWVDLTICRIGSPARVVPGVQELAIGTTASDEPLLRLCVERLDRAAEPLRIFLNVDHPLLAPAADILRESTVPYMLGIGGPRDPLLFAMPYGFDASAVPDVREPVRILDFGEHEDSAAPQAYRTLCTLIEMLSVGVLRQLASALREMTYVGPLRAVPPRSLLSQRGEPTARWADGLAAWTELLADQWTLVDDTNRWLARVGAGCQVEVQQLADPTADAEAPSFGESPAIVRRLQLAMVGSRARGASRDGPMKLGKRVLPCEVGSGISQVVPVIVAALTAKHGRLALFEQPELHVHPALQVGLGDLFIESSVSRQLLIETHSEHIILRLLRRIRETHDGDLPKDVPPFSAEKLSVLYVEQDDEGTSVRRLRVDANGEFIDRWPHGFFEERTEELF